MFCLVNVIYFCTLLNFEVIPVCTSHDFKSLAFYYKLIKIFNVLEIRSVNIATDLEIILTVYRSLHETWRIAFYFTFPAFIHFSKKQLLFTFFWRDAQLLVLELHQ